MAGVVLYVVLTQGRAFLRYAQDRPRAAVRSKEPNRAGLSGPPSGSKHHGNGGPERAALFGRFIDPAAFGRLTL